MRVIAGTARSLPLKTIEGLETRPTTDRIKETLFNMLTGYVPQAKFLDLFAGSGGIGIEALSRGAESCTFVEQAKNAAACIEDNLKFTKLADKAQVRKFDAVSFVSSLPEIDYDVIFMDPPRSGSTEQFMKSVVTLAPKKIVYISCDPQTQARDLKYLTRHGYKAMGAYPYDMFPFTKHAENIVLLTKN